MTTSRTTPQLLYTGHLSFLEHKLPASVIEFKRNDPLAEVWIVVPNQLTRLHLRRVLAKTLGAVANVRFMTVTDMMHKLAEPIVLREGWRTLGESVVDPLLATVVNANLNKLEYLAPIAATRGFRNALLRTRQELILHQIDPVRLNQVPLRDRERTAKVRDLILLLTHVSEFLSEHRLHDRVSLQALALRALLEDGAQTPPILLYVLYDLAPLTRAVLKLLASKSPTHAFLPWKAEDSSYKFTDLLCRWYTECGLIHEPQIDETVPYPAMNFVSAPKDSAVATELIRDIIYADDITIGEAAIQLPNSASLLTSVLESRCRTSGLTPYIYQSKTLGESAAGRGLAALSQLLDEKFTLAQVTAFLQTAPFNNPVASLTGEWSRLAQESLVLAGEHEWRQRVKRSIDKLQRRAEQISKSEDEDDNLTTLKRRIENGQALLVFLDELFKTVKNVNAERCWQSAIEVLWEYYRQKIELNEEFADLTVQLEQASILDQAYVPLTPATLKELILVSLETPGTRIGTFGSSTPLIAPREQCIGTSFDHVFLPGFNEGSVPYMQRQDPLLLDSDRKDINDSLSAVLPLASESQVRERFMLEMQLRSARNAVTIYSSRADADGRPQLLSPYVAELVAKQYHLADTAGELDEVLKRAPNRIVPSHPLEACPPTRAISESEYNRMALGDMQLGLGHLLQNDSFSLAMQVENARFREKSITRYEGFLQSDNARNALAHRYSPDQPIAATRLEEYWKCPFRFFVNKELEAYSPEEIDPLSPVTGRERGLLFHTILQRYHGERVDKQISEINYALSDLLAHARRAISEYARNNPVGPRFSLAKLERDVLVTLRTYHEELLSMGGTWHTRHIEISFGFGDKPFPNAARYVSNDNRAILFKGRIDRWDSDDSGTHVLITDYKSGKGPQKSSRGRDRRLQLGVYHLLAEQNTPDALVASRYMYLELDKQRTVSGEVEREHRLGAALDLSADMRNGIFIADPSENDPTVCMRCSVKLACGAQRHSAKELSAQTVPGMRVTRLVEDDGGMSGGDIDE